MPSDILLHLCIHLSAMLEWGLVTLLCLASGGAIFQLCRRKNRSASRLGAGALAVALTMIFLFRFDLAMQKFLSYAIMPSGLFWIALGVFALSLSARGSKRAALCAATLFATYTLMGNPWFASALVSILEEDSFLEPGAGGQRFDAVLVLGGGARLLSNGDVALSEHGDRVIRAARLFRSGKTPILVASGSSIEGVARAQDLSLITERLWIELGVPREAIRRLPEPKNTSEEVAAYKALVESAGWNRVGVVSSAWHLPRVMRRARAIGLELVPIAADHRSSMPPFHPAQLVPQPAAWRLAQLAAWEIVGMWVGR